MAGQGIASLIVTIGAKDKEIQDALAAIGIRARQTDAELKKLGGGALGVEATKSLQAMQRAQANLNDALVQTRDKASNAAIGLERIGGASKLTEKQLIKIQGLLRDGSQAFTALGETGTKAANQVNDALAKVTKSLSKGLDFGALGSNLRTVGFGITAGISAPIAAVGGLALKSAIDFEKSFAQVKRTVNGTVDSVGNLTQQGAQLRSEFLRLSTVIPKSAKELALLGSIAGQLGVPSNEVAKFTEVVTRLGTTTNLTAEEAAVAIAKIQNIFGAAGRDTEAFGSTLLKLGVNAAASETEIIEMAARIAAAGHQIGLSQAEVLAFATSLSSVGIEAEAGGSAISRVFQEISKAVAAGGSDLAAFANVARVPVTEFANLFKTNAAAAVTAFIKGLSELKGEGGNAFRALEILKLENVRVTNALLAAGGAAELVGDNIRMANDEFKNATELTRASNLQYDTAAAKLEILKNVFQNAGTEVGTAFLPAIKGLATGLTVVGGAIGAVAQQFAGLPTVVQGAIGGVALFGAALGPVLIGLGGMISSVKSLIEVLNLLKASEFIIGLGGISAAAAGIATAFTLAAAALVDFNTKRAAFQPTKPGSTEETRARFGLAGSEFTPQDAGAIIKSQQDIELAAEKTNLALMEQAKAFKALREQLVVASDMEGLTNVVLKMSEAGNLSTATLVGIAAKAKAFQSQGETLTPVLQSIITTVDRMTAATSLGKTGFAALGDQVASARKELDALSAADRRGLAEAIGLFSLEELHSQLGLSIAALKLFKEENAGSEAGLKKHAKGVQSLSDALKQLTDSRKAEVLAALKAGNTAEEIAAAYKISAVQVRNLATEEKNLAAIRKIEAASNQGLVEALRNVGNETMTDVKAAKEFLAALKRMAEINASDNMNTLQKNLKGVGVQYALLTPQQEKFLKSIERFDKMQKGVASLSQAFATLGQVSGQSFSKIVQGIGTVIASFNLALDGLQAVRAGIAIMGQKGRGLEGLTGTIGGLASQIAAFSQVATSGGSLLGSTAGGALLGSQIGVSIATAVGKGATLGSTAGWIGAAVGAAIAFYIAAHKSRDEKVMFDVGRDLGLSISKGLAKTIAEQEKTIGRQAAVLVNLPEIIKEAGGVRNFGTDTAIAKTRDLFVMLQTGALTARQVGATFNELFGQIIPEAIDKSTGLAKASFVELIKLAKEAKLEVPSVNDFIGQQLSQNVGAGLGTFFNTNTEAQKQAGELQKELTDLRQQLAKATGDEQKKIASQIDDVNKKLQIQTAIVKATTVTTQEQATGFAASIAATFFELQRAGFTTAAAAQAVGPAVTALQEQMSKAGLTGTSAFDSILKIVTLAGDEMAGPVLTAAGGIGQALAGLANTGLVNQEMFTGLTSQIAQAFNELVTQGKDGDAALRLLQPTLQTIFELQKRFGFSVDESTQAILDQAKAAGIVGDQFKSAQDRTADAAERAANALERLADKFGVLPAAAEDAANGVNSALVAIRSPEIKIDPAQVERDARRAAQEANDELSRILSNIRVNVDLDITNDFGIDPNNIHITEGATGGIVRSAGIQRFRRGGPTGTDTKLAWLTPGEFVLNQQQQARVNDALGIFGLKLSDIASNATVTRARGIQSFMDGGQVLPFDQSISVATPIQAFARQDAKSAVMQTIYITANANIKAWDGASVRQAVVGPGGMADMLIESLGRDERGRGTTLHNIVAKKR